MRILSITPIRVSDEELARRQERYDRRSPRGLQVRLQNLAIDSDVPHALENAGDIRASEAALIERYAAADPAEWDGFLPDCVLDPVVEHADRFAAPVFGIGRLTAQFLYAQGAKVASVARNDAIANELDRKLELYGVRGVWPTIVLDLSVDDIDDDASWGAAVSRAVEGVDADYVINACSAVNVTDLKGRPVLVDPTRAALSLLGLRMALSGAV